MSCRGSIFRSAVTGSDGTVDPGYLALYWIVAVTISVIPLVAGAGCWLAFREPTRAAEILQGTGVAIGAIGAQAAAAIAAVGAFRMGDKAKTPQPAAGGS